MHQSLPFFGTPSIPSLPRDETVVSGDQPPLTRYYQDKFPVFTYALDHVRPCTYSAKRMGMDSVLTTTMLLGHILVVLQWRTLNSRETCHTLAIVGDLCAARVRSTAVLQV